MDTRLGRTSFAASASASKPLTLPHWDPGDSGATDYCNETDMHFAGKDLSPSPSFPHPPSNSNIFFPASPLPISAPFLGCTRPPAPSPRLTIPWKSMTVKVRYTTEGLQSPRVSTRAAKECSGLHKNRENPTSRISSSLCYNPDELRQLVGERARSNNVSGSRRKWLAQRVANWDAQHKSVEKSKEEHLIRVRRRADSANVVG